MPPQELSSSVPEEILYVAEQPIVFTLRTTIGQQLLAYVADEEPDFTWVLLAPCTEGMLRDLRDDRLAVREALLGSRLWLARRDPEQRWDGCWSVEPAEIPEDHLPRPGTLLHPDAAA